MILQTPSNAHFQTRFKRPSNARRPCRFSSADALQTPFKRQITHTTFKRPTYAKPFRVQTPFKRLHPHPPIPPTRTRARGLEAPRLRSLKAIFCRRTYLDDKRRPFCARKRRRPRRSRAYRRRGAFTERRKPMTAHVLVCGQLFRGPEQRTSKTGKPFVTATIRAKDGEAAQLYDKLVGIVST